MLDSVFRLTGNKWDRHKALGNIKQMLWEVLLHSEDKPDSEAGWTSDPINVLKLA